MTIAAEMAKILAADATLQARLAAFDFGGATTAPAIFTFDPAPAECGTPLVTITQIASTPYATRGQRGAEIGVSVSLWGDRWRGDSSLYALAQVIWRLLDRATFTVANYDLGTVEASAPVRVVDVDGFPGYQVTVLVRILETVT